MIYVWLAVLISCDQNCDQEVAGLWQLEEAKVDALEKKHSPVFLKINKNNSFSVSRPSGGTAGIYQIRSNKIHLKSQDIKWFNTSWEFKCMGDHMLLQGTERGFRGTFLRFKSIQGIPDFQEFEESLLGEWMIYQVKNESALEYPDNTRLELHSEGLYSISDKTGIVESGRVIINTRHKKLIFEDLGMIWNVWFYGKELRLQNKESKLLYRLRRINH